ncbi:MAG: lipopolysaccharide transport periplasmic protein LptA [Candidatus Competibacterales bacterium]
MSRLPGEAKALAVALGLWGLTLGSGVANALPEDRDQPIYLEADNAEFDQQSGTMVYRGNVVLTQGSLGLMADQATLYTRDGELQRMEATGQPVRFRYTHAHDKPQINGEGSRVEYDVSDAQVVVTGDPVRFTQGGDVITGARAVYHLTTDRVTMEGLGERIKIELAPRRGS